MKVGIITSSIHEKKSTMNKNRQEVLRQATHIHRENLRRSLEHRLEIARAKGDDKLVRQLEAEASYLHIR